MKSKIRLGLKLILFVIASSVAFTVFLTLCYMVPLDIVNYRASMDELSREGWYTDVLSLRPGYEENFHSDQPSIQSTFDDMLIYAHTYGDPDKNPLYNAMANGTETAGVDYKYWHGYSGILRILLQFFDCKEIKFLCFIFQFLLVVMLSLLIRERAGNLLMGLFLTQYVLLMPLTVAVSVFFTFTVDVAFLGILIYSRLEKRMYDPARVCFFFCSIGMLTIFLEELVFGVMSWGMVALWIVILYGKNKTVSENVRYVIASGISWVIGYGGLWLMKWVIGSIVIGENLFLAAFEKIALRSSGGADGATGLMGLLERFISVRLNYKYYFYPVYFVILLIWLAVIVLRIIKNRLRYDSRTYALGLISLAPIVWYFVLSNHTTGHRFMTHKIITVTVIALLAIAVISSGTDILLSHEKTGHTDRKTLLYKSGLLLIPLIPACLVTYFITNEFQVKNVNVPGIDLEISECENGSLKMSFSPGYETVESIGLALSPGQSDGSYEFRLSDKNGIVYSEQLPMQLFYDSHWQIVPLDWKVKPSTEYTLEIIPDCTSGFEGTVTAIFPGADWVNDLGTVLNEGDNKGSQITCCINYKNRVRGREWIFYVLTYYMIFVDLILVFSLRKEKTEAHSDVG